MSKLVIQLPKPLPASNDCLPHAALSLGAVRGSGTKPMPAMVSTLVLEEQLGNWVLNRLDERGGFAGDTWHGSREDALWQVEREFGVRIGDDGSAVVQPRMPS